MMHDTYSALGKKLGSIFIVIIALVWGLPSARLLVGQTMLSNFVGVVSDSSGAAIPNATVTVTNEGTKAQRTAQTDSRGSYRIDGILVGTYTLKVEASGFKTFEQANIVLTPALEKRVDVTLQIGAVTQTVRVTSTVPVLQSDSATISSSLPSLMYTEKPLVTMSRGAIITEMLQWAPGSAAGEATYQFAGNRPDMLQVNEEGLQFNWISGTVAPSGIEDVSAVITNAPAEYARPATVNVTLRSGTDQLHGEYWRAFVNPCLNATDTPLSHPKRPACVTSWRQFADVGGPVYIPHIYDGRDKTFFFFTWGRPNSFNVALTPVTASYPTQAMQAGDFSNYPITIVDPRTGQPFAGNIIPSSRINPFANAVINTFYKSPNVHYVGSPNSFVNNVQIPQARFRQDTDWVVKVDQNIGTKDILSGFWQRNQVISNITDPYFVGAQAFDTGGQDKVGNWAAGFVYTHTFSPKVVNELRAGVTRFVYPHCQIDPTNVQAGTIVSGASFVKQWGLQGISAPDLCGMPQLSISNWQYTYNDNESEDIDTRYSGYDNLSFIMGSHTFKVGYSGIKLLQDGPDKGPYFGSFNFSGFFTGEPFADFLLGLPNTFQSFTTRPIVAARMWEHGVFFQDDFRVNSKLTLNYGIRWDKYTVPYDKNGLYYNFDPKTFSIVVPDQHAVQNVNPAWPSQIFPIKLASQVGFPSKLINGSSSWQPRFGFAYMLTPRSVLRGGYGIYNGDMRFASLQSGGPFAITDSFINQKLIGSPTGALYSMPDPFPPAANTASAATATGYALNYRPAYSMNWNLTFEHQIAPNWGVQVTYRGVKNTQLPWVQNLNAIEASTTPFSQSRLPYPNLQTINLVQNGGNSWYDGIVAQVNHPLARGFYITAAYTREWSGGLQGGSYANDQSAFTPEYPFNLARDEGPDPAYPSNDFILDWVWNLPVGSGQHFFASANRILNGIIGNWSTVGSISYRSGWFFTPVLNGIDVGNIGNSSGRRPNVVPGCNPYAGARKETSGLWFNPSCFTAPPAGELGNAGVDSLVGPGASQVNLSVYKEFPFRIFRHEGSKIQIGINIDDLFNQTAFATPNAVVNSPLGGKILGTTYSRGLYNDEGCCGRMMVGNMRVVF